MISARAIWPLLRAYARHIGLLLDEAELRRGLEHRLLILPIWVRTYMGFGALWMRWAAPALMIGRWRRFERLREEDREMLAGRLQRDTRFFIRGLFIGIKSLMFACCYGSSAFFDRIGYRPAGFAARESLGP